MAHKPRFGHLLPRSLVIMISVSALAAVFALPASASSGGGCQGGGYEPSGTTWYSEIWVFDKYGAGVAESPAEHLSY